MPDISVIIPAYREEKVIYGVVEKVRQVMDATGQSYEIIVVDDGSDDKTAAEAQKGSRSPSYATTGAKAGINALQRSPQTRPALRVCQARHCGYE